MKAFLSVLLMSMITVLCSAQVKEPEFEMEPYFFERADSTFETPLPCESAYVKAKAGASLYLTGMGSVKTYYYIKGTGSSKGLNVSSTDILINTGGMSPQQTLSLIKLDVLDSKRRWKTGSSGTFSGTSMNEDNSVTIKYKKYGENSVIISTAGLEPGEYCLAITNMMTNTKSAKVYTFAAFK
jgi:hypothetical protein